MDIASWLSRNFKAQKVGATNEFIFSCPTCGHSRFYFNIKKKIGYCHKDKCHWTPTLEDLIRLSNSRPDELSNSEQISDESELEIKIPDGSEKLVKMKSGEFVTDFPIASEKVRERGISIEDQFRFNLYIGNGRIYIPVYFNGKLVNYVGRAIWWLPSYIPRYEYFKGAKTSAYIFNWDSAKLWPELTLQENTFNAIRYKNQLQCTTNFGSHLSKTQIDLIAKANTKLVVIMWDEGAEKNAYRAVKELRSIGIPSAYCVMKGQPDSHEDGYLWEILNKARKVASEGNKMWVKNE